MKNFEYDEKYMMEHEDEFETLEYGNLEDSENFRYQAIFNGSYSYCDIEANSEEGWIKIIVMNPNKDDEQDLMKDLVSIITSFCCRLYGLRRMKNKVDKIKSVLYEQKT